MATKDDLTNSMVNSFNTGATLQSTVRDFIQTTVRDGYSGKDAADRVAASVTDFRESIEPSILASTDQKGMRKKRDNVINDVSRICRELLGYSIVCTSRKEGIYEAQVPAPRKVAASPATPSPADVCSRMHFDNTKHIVIPRSISDFEVLTNALREEKSIPASTVVLDTEVSCKGILEVLVRTSSHSLKDFGMAVMELVKEGKGV